MPDWIRTQFDQVHSIYAQLSDNNGPVDLPYGTTVTFSGRLTGTTAPSVGGVATVVRAGATPDDPNRGVVRYDVTTTDMLNPGLFFCKWKLVPPDFTFTQSFPEDGYMTLIILPSV